MDNFERILRNAQAGDKDAINELLYEYLPLIDGLVYQYGKGIDRDELKSYLLQKFIENLKNFKIF